MMRSKHEIPRKSDYMKAYSFNLIQTERTNSELEHEENVGKIDGAFYPIFAWQIMGKQKEHQLNKGDTREEATAKKNNLVSNNAACPNERLQEVRSVQKSTTENGHQVVVESRTDVLGIYPKRYTTTCYIKPKVVPTWYTESLLLFIGSTKRRYDEKVYFKTQTKPYYWSENMTTEVNFPPTKTYLSEVFMPTEQTKYHYISLEPQQVEVASS